MNFIRKNTRAISLIVVYFFTVLMQAGSLLLLAISLLFDNNLVESSFCKSRNRFNYYCYCGNSFILERNRCWVRLF
ncbi:hypothetical protein EfsSVR2332_15750 [Enterococcus faecalis]|uniref:Uncharacterized protein n=1 Tax=Enterococcus faecalis TaxID=1351 RepID=A0AC59HPC3_ENTFL|nr:hypothetical protein EfsSVR2332_15750 [Enterococcus faecalis]